MLVILEGFGLYLAVTLLAVLVGGGVLRGLRITTLRESALLLAPVVTLMLWTLVVGLAVGLGVPVKVLAPWFWGSSLLLAVYGWKTFQPAWSSSKWVLGVCLLAPIVLMAKHFFFGLTDYSGSIPPDGWSYMTYSAYIWEHGRGTEGGLSPAFQYAAHLNAARYISRALISVFSPLSHVHDTQSVAALYQAFTLFVIACSTACCLSGLKLRRSVVAIGAFFSVVSGWMANLVWAFNFDNGIALVYMPALAALLLHMNPRLMKWRVLLAMGLGATLYTYPELVPLILGCAFLIAVPRLLTPWKDWYAWMSALLMSGVLAFLLFLPEADAMVSFWSSQFKGVQEATALRTAEGYFPGVKMMSLLPGALWGLGHEHLLNDYVGFRNGLGWVLSFFSLAGLWVLIKRGQWGFVLSVLLLLAATAYWVFKKDYSYAAYKMINVNWWALASTAVLGGAACWEVAKTRKRRVGVGFLLVLVGVAWVSQAYHGSSRKVMARYIKSPSQAVNAPAFRQVKEILPHLKGSPVLNLVEDWLAYEWAIYYLRDTPLFLPVYHMLMDQGHVIPFLKRAAPVDPHSCRFALTDHYFDGQGAHLMGWEKIWEGGAYQLWSLPGDQWVMKSKVHSSYGTELYQQRPFFWMGTSRVSMEFFAGTEGRLMFGASFMRGPGLEPDEPCKLLIETDVSAHEVEIATGYHGFSLPAQAGSNQVYLTVLNEKRSEALSGTDPRLLMLGVWDLDVALDEEEGGGLGHVYLAGMDNLNGLERRDGIPFTWLGRDEVSVDIQSSVEGFVYLTARSIPGPSLPDNPERGLRVKDAGGQETVYRFKEGVQSFPLTATMGTNQVILQALDEPAVDVVGAGDRRALLVGLERPRVWAAGKSK